MTDNKKPIKYLNLTHEDFVDQLIKWSKIYFPRESKNLEKKASSGRHFIELSSFIGDVLSFHMEDRFRNSNIITANDPRMVVLLAEAKGYKFRGPTGARGEQSFYLQVPAVTSSAGNYVPDMRYAFNFRNVQLQNNNGVFFEALDDVDFSSVNISSSLEAKVSKSDPNSGRPQNFILKKNVEVIAGKTLTETLSIGGYVPFREVKLSSRNILDVISVKDSDGEEWFEVDYLAQEAIFQGITNTADDSDDVPYNLKIKSVPRRFVKRINPLTGKTSLFFGAGKASDIGDPIVPDISRLALDLKGKLTFSPPTIDPQNFLKTRTLGLAPTNTTLTVKVRSGGGIISNTAESSLTDVVSKEVEYDSSLDGTSLNETVSSFTSRNLSPIEGGEEAESIDIAKLHAAANFASQGRVITKEDYIVRALSLPSKFGTVFRVYPVNNCERNGGVRLYVLAKNSSGQVVTPSTSLKKNIKTYLSMFSRMGQGIDIIDGKIINIGIEYTLVVEPGFSKSRVKFDTMLKVKKMFEINKWQLNQPIILDEIKCLIKDTPGVISIPELKIRNKNNILDGSNYSSFSYAIDSNTRSGIIFGIPEGIFEVKFDKDIKAGAL